MITVVIFNNFYQPVNSFQWKNKLLLYFKQFMVEFTLASSLRLCSSVVRAGDS